MNALAFDKQLSFSAALPNGSQRSVTVSTLWGDDSLTVMLEAVSPEKGGHDTTVEITAEAATSDDPKGVENLVVAVMGGLLWVHYPSVDWATGQDMASDICDGDIDEVIAEYRAPFNHLSIADLWSDALDLVVTLTALLAGGDDVAIMPGCI